MLGKEAKLKNNLPLFLLGINTNADEIHQAMERIYTLITKTIKITFSRFHK